MKRDIISLGKNCFISGALRELGIIERRKDLFDDLGTDNLGALANSLSKRLEDFFSGLEHLDFYGISGSGSRHFVYDKRSGVLSAHHWFVGKDRKECYEKFIANHDTKGFIKRLTNANNPIILRTNGPKTKLDEVVYLRNVLADIRQNEDFTLCVFQDAIWAEFEDWQSFLGLETRSLMTFRTPVYTAPAEVYPDPMPVMKWFLDKSDYSRWAKIFDYIFSELGLDIKPKDPLGIKWI